MLDAEKFKHELTLQNMTVSELSARSGMNYSHLSNMKNGKIKDVKFETIINLARHLNNIPPYRLICDLILDLARQNIRDSIGSLPKDQWVAYIEGTLGKGAKRIPISNRFPIIGRVMANGQHNLPSDFGKIKTTRNSYETIPFDNVIDPDAYAVVVDDPTLASEIRPGSILLFSPNHEIDNISLCLVRTKSTDNIWVRYVAVHEDQYILLTKNEITKPIVLIKTGVHQIHRCLARYVEEATEAK